MQQKLDPKAKWLFFLHYVLHILFLIILIQIWGLNSRFYYYSPYTYSLFWFVLVLFTLLISFGWSGLVYSNYSYELAKEGLIVRRGVIRKFVSTIPYSRIQNTDLRRGIFERILGLTSVMAQTAGYSTITSIYSRYGYAFAEGSIPGLSQKDAEKLRILLLKKVKSNKGQGL